MNGVNETELKLTRSHKQLRFGPSLSCPWNTQSFLSFMLLSPNSLTVKARVFKSVEIDNAYSFKLALQHDSRQTVSEFGDKSIMERKLCVFQGHDKDGPNLSCLWERGLDFHKGVYSDSCGVHRITGLRSYDLIFVGQELDVDLTSSLLARSYIS
ncbi:unnamed protein product [Cuscuta campestris]|uniref:Uncharacterized protein n=1 Tax=Cuscuta campestris TaxID=132261 RepID=A0A484LVD0_9ASTE|nr:unnamed protein product [Cuscuta campestris]